MIENLLNDKKVSNHFGIWFKTIYFLLAQKWHRRLQNCLHAVKKGKTPPRFELQTPEVMQLGGTS